jgi:PAS domain S-box-containing protein
MMESAAYSSKWLAVTLSAEGRIASLTPSAEQVTGYAAQELVGKPVTDIFSDLTAFEMPRILDMVKGCGYWQGRLVYQSLEGELLAAGSTLSVLAEKHPHSPGYLLISNLNRSSLLGEEDDSIVSEIATTLRMFAHDLNNPLAVMMGFAQLLILNQNCQGTIRSDIEKIYSELKHVIQVVERLHEYAHSLREKPPMDQKSRAVVNA